MTSGAWIQGKERITCSPQKTVTSPQKFESSMLPEEGWAEAPDDEAFRGLVGSQTDGSALIHGKVSIFPPAFTLRSAKLTRRGRIQARLTDVNLA